MKNAVSAKAAKLLRKVAAHILEEPKRFIMQELMRKGQPGVVEQFGRIDVARPLPPCGTAACIAGWVCILGETPNVDKNDANAILEISEDAGERLFFVPNWPERYKRKWNATTDLNVRARLGKTRINHFIKTGE